MGSVEEIHREDWVPYLDDFTREHHGWQVDLEVQGSGEDGRIEAHEIPLQGISADLRRGAHCISIMVGQEHTPGLTHVISDASRLRVRKTAGGSDAAIEIESRQGEKTVLKLHELQKVA